ncbi:uncharacterized protein LOC143074821 [Mytilus galloprovincialis]|uniref:uncharacterized protein LOC143074821 n=1 Tax=Mytilus galloprovincialis TaxID=29158 RepID=UPI003F7C5599
MHKFVLICFLVIISLSIAQKNKRGKNVLANKVITDIEKCRTCKRDFKTTELRELCTELYCSKDKSRRNLQTPKRCKSCAKEFKFQKKQQRCKEVFCAGSSTVDPSTFAGRALAFTVDMLCAYCKARNNYSCLVQYGCQM